MVTSEIRVSDRLPLADFFIFVILFVIVTKLFVE